MKSKHFLSLLIFIGLAIFVTFPLITNPVSLAAVAKEEFFLSYIINWNIQALTHYPAKIFQAPFFYPMRDTLAFSDPLFTSSIIALPFVKIFSQPFLAYTVNLILSFILNGFAVYLVIHQLSKNFWASLVSGVLFSFSIGRIDALEHLQVLTMYWIPLGIYFFLKFIRQKKARYAFLIALCFLLQALNTVFLGYVYVFTLGFFTLIYFLKRKITKPQLWLLLKYFTVALAIVAIIFIPYFRVSQRWQATRSLQDVFAGSSYFPEYLYPTHSSRLESLAQAIMVKHPWPSYLGAAVSILSILAIISFFRSRQTRQPAVLAGLAIAGGGLVMSFGPYFQLLKQKASLPIPLPYWLAYYLIPGFKSMRVPQRWSHLALLGFSILVGLWLASSLKKLKPKLLKILSILIITVVILEIRLPLFTTPVVTQSQIPPVYHWLAQQPSSIVMELPLQTWVMPLSDLEIERLHFHSFFLKAEHTFVNGYSGFEPPSWGKTMAVFRTSSPDQAIATLNHLGVDLLIVHWQDMDQLYQKDKEALPLKSTLETIETSQEFIKLYTDDQTTVYKI